MPVVSRFYGIVIKMYYDDHAKPHFHVEYGEKEAKFSLPQLKAFEGKVPNRVKSMVFEWAAQHLDELMDDWKRCHEGIVPKPIKPLE